MVIYECQYGDNEHNQTEGQGEKNMNNNITVTILDVSRLLSRIEEVRVKDSTAAESLSELVDQQGQVCFTPNYWARVIVTDERQEKHFEKLVIVTLDGRKLITGSASFLSTFLDLYKQLAGEQEPVVYIALKRASKKYPGKGFLVCTI